MYICYITQKKMAKNMLNACLGYFVCSVKWLGGFSCKTYPFLIQSQCYGFTSCSTARVILEQVLSFVTCESQTHTEVTTR